MKDSKLNRPEPIVTSENMYFFNASSNVATTINTLESGKPILIIDLYSNGLLLLKELRAYLGKKMPNKSFTEQREYRAAYRKLSNLILIEIEDHELTLAKSPSIGWFIILYPDIKNFHLPFPQVQGLNSSWQWYHKGISIPVLRNKIHPFYGTYFPTRFEHLILFDNWIKRYEGVKKTAIDVGTGSGVLSFLIVKYGFQKVYGTDTNPNAIHGLNQFMKDTKLSRKIELDEGHLFGAWEKQTELIVFNPPWLPVSRDLNRLDEAIYYNDELFPAFFEAAKVRLLPDGKIVILFSNLAQITEETTEHPIKNELEKGDRFKLEKCYKKSVKAASDKTKRDQHWRSLEVVELWELSLK
jgi:SAM-dependent methyltransferase